MARSIFALETFAFLSFAACAANMRADAALDAPSGDGATWPCPVRWVATASGGCAPAVLVCADGGGALAGVCDGVEIARSVAVGEPDAGGGSLFRLPDGAIGGAWSAPESVAQSPADDFMPAAGIPGCATGWTRIADGTCDPRLPADCGSDARALPGGACAPGRASDCASGEWVDVASESGSARVVRVRAGADDASADGSVLRPFGTLAAAAASAGEDSWLLLSAGTYVSRLALATGLHVVGVCASRVRIGSTTVAPVIEASGPRAAIDVRGVTVAPQGSGIVVRGGARGSLRNVRVTGANGIGVQCTGVGSTLDVQFTLIDATRTGTPAAPVPGLACDAGAHVTARGVAIVDSATFGASASGRGTSLQLRDSVVATTHAATGTDPYTDGLAAFAGANVHVDRCVFDANGEEAALSQDDGTSVTLQDSIVRGPASGATGPWGVRAEYRGSMVVIRTLFDRLHWLALAADESGSITVSDTVVRRVVPWVGALSIGMQASHSGHIAGSRVLLDENQNGGAVISDAGSLLELSDSIVRGSVPRGDGHQGVGVRLSPGGRATLTRVRIEGNSNQAVLATGVGAAAVLDHTLVIGTVDGGSGGSGYGLMAAMGASIRARHSSIVSSNAVGALATLDGTLDLTDCRIARSPWGVAAVDAAEIALRRVFIQDAHQSAVVAQGARGVVSIADSGVLGPMTTAMGEFGRGLQASTGGRIAATRVAVSNASHFGALAFLEDSSLTLEDVIVVDTQPADRGFGAGVGVYGGARATLERVAVRGASGAGIACVPNVDALGLRGGGRIDGRDVFVANVRTSQLEFDLAGNPTGRSVAYGMLVGAMSSIDATRATLTDGGYGFYAVGSLTIRSGLIARQLDAAGAFRDSAATLFDVVRVDNASDVVRETSLPSGSSLPAPTSLCATSSCP